MGRSSLVRKNVRPLKEGNRLSKRQRGFECLEDRCLLATLANAAAMIDLSRISGATIITHGLNPGGDRNYMASIGEAIRRDAGGYLVTHDIGFPGSDGFTVSDFSQGNDADARGELVFLFNWSLPSFVPSPGWGEASGDALFSILAGLGIVNPAVSGASLPLHFIAHSFGSAVTSEAVERLAAYNVPVDHVTYLDPHDFAQTTLLGEDGLIWDVGQELWTTGSPASPRFEEGYGATVWNNVAFADAYYQTRNYLDSGKGFRFGESLAKLSGSRVGNAILPFLGRELERAAGRQFLPSGRPIPGAYNVHLTDSNLVGSEDDHNFVWSGFYSSTVADPETSEKGYTYSRLAHPFASPFRPQISGSAGAFFHSSQDHQWSSTLLVAGSFGDEGRTEPSTSFPNEMETSRALPRWNPLDIFNGDFEEGRYTWIADILHEPLVSDEPLIPGWSFHGGGTSEAMASVRPLAVVGGNRAGFLDAGFFVRASSLRHNHTYIPTAATHLEFSLKREFASEDFRVEVLLGDQLIRSIPLLDTDGSFVDYQVPIPQNLKGETTNIEFRLVGGQKTIFSSRVLVDNVGFAQLFSPSPYVDLVPTSVEPVQTFVTGNTLIVAAEVQNVGNQASGGYNVQFKLSRDPTFATSVTVLPVVPRVGIGAGSVNRWTEQLILPAGLQPGQYWMRMEVDPANVIAESQDDNNQASSLIPWNLSVLPSATYDLAARSLEAPSTASVGSSIDLFLQVDNASPVVSSTYRVNYYLSNDAALGPSDISIGFSDHSALGANSSIRLPDVLTIPSGTAAGQYVILPIIIASGESNLTNNVPAHLPSVEVRTSGSGTAFQYPIHNARTAEQLSQGFDNSFTYEGKSYIGHLGMDFEGRVGETPVFAAADGEVAEVFYGGAEWGHIVIVRHDSPGTDEDLFSVYAHVLPSVAKGLPVKRGEQIATVGPKAVGSTGPHLHFEIRSGEAADDPVPQPGYHRDKLVQVGPNSYVVQGVANVVWHDPAIIIEGSGAPPDTRPDLQAIMVNAGLQAQAGARIPVYAEVSNQGGQSFYEVQYFLSPGKAIDSNSRPLGRFVITARNDETNIDRFTKQVILPLDLVAGQRYWIGMVIDPLNTIEELNELNNKVSDTNAVSIVPTPPVPQPDLIGARLNFAPAKSSYAWGDRGYVEYSVENIGTAASIATQAKLYLTDDPRFPTFREELSRVNIPALTPGAQAGGRGVRLGFRLPSDPPAGYAGGPLYLRLETVSNQPELSTDNNAGVGNGVDWLLLSGEPPRLGLPDLVGTQLSVQSQQVYYWGQDLSVSYTVTNQGTEPSGDFSYRVFLAPQSSFPGGGFRLRTDSVASLAPGESRTIEFSSRVPTIPPSGFTNGSLFLGVELNSDRAVDESNFANNRGFSAGGDYLSLPMVPLQASPAPTIGQFTTNKPQIVRGQKLDLSAIDVLDDLNVVNEVVFQLDIDGNGMWDDADLYLDHGSKVGASFAPSFVATITSGLAWPTGFVTLMARAKDNFGLLSAVSTLQVEVLGIATGPFPDDALENNDTSQTATHLGANPNVVIPNLAVIAGDADHYTFDVIGDASTIDLKITFTQDAYQGPGVPVGNLDLELRRLDNLAAATGFSGTSAAGVTSERIFRGPLADGRYVLKVYGDANPNYTLSTSFAPVAGAPQAGPLEVSLLAPVQGETVEVRMPVASGTADGAAFYADLDHNGTLSFDELLAQDFSLLDDLDGKYRGVFSTATLPPGEFSLYAFPFREYDLDGLPVSVSIDVLPNHAAVVSNIVAPTSVVQGAPATIRAQVFDADPRGSVGKVSLYLDSANNGLLNPEDHYLGDAQLFGGEWVWSGDAIEWPLDDGQVLIVAQDNLGLDSPPVVVNFTVEASDNLVATIGALVAPRSVIKGQSLALLAADVIDPNGDTLTARFFHDADGDRAFGAGDQLLGLGSQSGDDWTFTTATAQLLAGVHRFFIEVEDDGVPNFSVVGSIDVLVIDTTGPRLIGQSPNGPVIGSIDRLTLIFDEPLEPASIGLNDILSFQGPSGPILATALQSVAGSENRQFELVFPRQIGIGNYSLTVGPDLLDFAGNPVDQDADGVSGEPVEDVAIVEFALQPPIADFVWGKSFGGTQSDIPFLSAVSSDGTTYVAGQFTGTVNFNPGGTPYQFTANGTNGASSRDIFLAAFWPDGSLRWARAFSGTGNNELPVGLALDASGNIYLAGIYSGTIGSGIGFTSQGGDDTFLHKITPDGTSSWARNIAGPGVTRGRSMTLQGDSLYVTGYFDNSLIVGTSTFTGQGDYDPFVAKYNLSGTFQWARAFGGPNYENTEDVEVLPNGRVAIVGTYQTSATFEQFTLSGGQGFQVYLESANGALQSVAGTDAGAQYIESAGQEYFIVGWLEGTRSVDPSGNTILTSIGSSDTYLAKYDSNHNFLWARQIDVSRIEETAADAQGNLYLVGETGGDVDPDPNRTYIVPINTNSPDALFLKITSQGNLAWARAIGSTQHDTGFAISVDPAGNVYAAGTFQGPVVTDSAGQVTPVLQSFGSQDVFRVKLSSPAVNAAPVLADVPSEIFIGEGSLASFDANATDSDVGQSLQFSLGAGEPAGATIHSQSGLFAWTPGESHGPGTYPVRVRVIDNGSPAVSDERTVLIHVAEVNLPPVPATISSQTVFEGQTLTVPIGASDPDLPLQTLQFTLEPGAPSGAAINANTGVFTWTPNETHGPGAYNVSVRVSDSGNSPLSAVTSFSITALEANAPPVLQPLADQTVYHGQTFAVVAAATDADLPTQDLTFRLVGQVPGGASIDPQTGEFYWLPDAGITPGTYLIQIEARDNGAPSQSATSTFSVEVRPLATITDVLVSSSSWSASFLSYLAGQNLGNGGYSLPDGNGAQLLPLPWTNLNQIKIAFSEDVEVSSDDLSVFGVNVASYTPSAFSYDATATTFIATWTFGTSLSTDKLFVVLDSDPASGVRDEAGNALDGEWDNPTLTTDTASDSFPSGDGIDGGDFIFRFNVVAGDADRNGVVTGLDGNGVRNRLLKRPGDATYSHMFDVDGNAVITGLDGNAVRNRLLQRLPTGEPWVPEMQNTLASSFVNWMGGATTLAASDKSLPSPPLSQQPNSAGLSVPMGDKLVSASKAAVITLGTSPSTILHDAADAAISQLSSEDLRISLVELEKICLPIV